MSAAEAAITEALWNKVLDAFDDDELHNKFLEHARMSGGLPDAARRYREHQASLGEEIDEATAEQIDKRLRAIAILAVAEMQAMREPLRAPSFRLKVVLQVVIAVIFIGALIGFVKALLM